jgi:hypothetical protein
MKTGAWHSLPGPRQSLSKRLKMVVPVEADANSVLRGETALISRRRPAFEYSLTAVLPTGKEGWTCDLIVYTIR